MNSAADGVVQNIAQGWKLRPRDTRMRDQLILIPLTDGGRQSCVLKLYTMNCVDVQVNLKLSAVKNELNAVLHFVKIVKRTRNLATTDLSFIGTLENTKDVIITFQVWCLGCTSTITCIDKPIRDKSGYLENGHALYVWSCSSWSRWQMVDGSRAARSLFTTNGRFR